MSIVNIYGQRAVVTTTSGAHEVYESEAIAKAVADHADNRVTMTQTVESLVDDAALIGTFDTLAKAIGTARRGASPIAPPAPETEVEPETIENIDKET